MNFILDISEINQESKMDMHIQVKRISYIFNEKHHNHKTSLFLSLKLGLQLLDMEMV